MTNEVKKSGVAAAGSDRKIAARFFLADDIRTEVSGKQFLIGFYPDSVLVMQTPADAPPPSLETPVGTEGIAFLFSVSGPPGNFKFKIFGNAESEQEVVMAEGTLAITAEKDSANVIVRLRPFVTASFGKKLVAIEVDGVRHNFHYEVRRGAASGSTRTTA